MAVLKLTAALRKELAARQACKAQIKALEDRANEASAKILEAMQKQGVAEFVELVRYTSVNSKLPIEVTVDPFDAGVYVRVLTGDEVTERVKFDVQTRTTTKIDWKKLAEKGVDAAVIKYATEEKTGEPFLGARVQKD